MAKCVLHGWSRVWSCLAVPAPSFAVSTSQPTFTRLCTRFYSKAPPKLAPQEVTAILRASEYSQDVGSGSIRSVDYNQLPSNNPCEDRFSIAKCLLTTGMLFGVFDGHNGDTCAHVTSQRLLDYIALSILPSKLLEEYAASEQTLVEFLHEMDKISQEQQFYHQVGLKAFAQYLLKERRKTGSFKMDEAVVAAFEQLDSDLSNEVQNGIRRHLEEAFKLVLAGACACVAHVDDEHIHVASSGDCKAVLGVLGDDNVWIAKPLSKEHNADNVDEIKRVLSEHPQSEKNNIVQYNRLLGRLAPLRAFGDFSFKWSASLLEELVVPFDGSSNIVSKKIYQTPPYLTAKPEVMYHQLSPKDKFLVIASDGLWERMMPHKVVKLIGEFMSGKQVLDRLELPNPNMQLGQVNQILLQRREGLNNKPADTNAATHLMRSCLGWTEYGIEHSQLSEMLSLPKQIVREFRDDMTILVLFFDSDFLRQSPA